MTYLYLAVKVENVKVFPEFSMSPCSLVPSVTDTLNQFELIIIIIMTFKGAIQDF